VQPFPTTPHVVIVGRDLEGVGPAYNVNPWQNFGPVALMPAAWYDSGALIRGGTVTRRLAWTPYSYPSVGREPGMFPPPDIPAVPAVPGDRGALSYRKRSLGRTVSAGSATQAPGQVTG
jgi:hypothetical protein